MTQTLEKGKNNNKDTLLSNLIMLYFIILPLSYVLRLQFGVIALFTYPIIYLILIFRYRKFLTKRKTFACVVCFFMASLPYSLMGYYYYLYNWFGLLYLFFVTTLPWFLVAINIDDLNEILISYKKNAKWILISNIILIAYCIFTERNMFGNMEISYSILPLAIFSFYSFTTSKKIKHLLYFIVSSLTIVAVGSRGPLICILIFIFIFMLTNAKKQKILTIIFLIISIFFIYNFNTIILNMISVFEKYDIPSRTLYKIIESDFTDGTGRNKIYATTLDLLNEYPVFGVGLGVERITINQKFNNMQKDMSSSYPHNLILEILVQFGYVIGILVILFVAFIILRALKKSNLVEKNILIIFGTMEGVRLMISSSYLLSPIIFMFLGFCFRKSLLAKEEKAYEKDCNYLTE